MNRAFLCTLLVLKLVHTVPAQHTLPEAEDWAEGIETDQEELDWLDDWEWLLDHPYDLNTVTRAQLESIPGVLSADAELVVAHRVVISRFRTPDELPLIPGLSAIAARMIRQCVTVSEKGDFAGTTLKLRTRAVHDLQQRRGFKKSLYRGVPLKSYFRLTAEQQGLFEAGLLHEKDAGETMERGFHSGYVMLGNVGRLARIVAGDYRLEVGQGLALWNSSASGKGGVPATAIRKRGRGIVPHRSSDESGFLRGMAFTTAVGLGRWSLEVTPFISSRKLAATLDRQGCVTSLYEAGLFRTESEAEKEEQVNETLFGTRVAFISGNKWSGGITYSRTIVDRAVCDNPSPLGGNQGGTGAIDVDASFGPLFLFGETACQLSGGTAFLAGAQLSFGRKGSVAIVHRNYSDNFTNRHAQGFGERDETSDESGMYLGLTLKPAEPLSLNSFLDLFRRPSAARLFGHEFVLHADVRASSSVDVSLRYSSKVTQEASTSVDAAGREIEIPEERIRQRLRFNAMVDVIRHLRWKGRIELSRVSRASPPGWESGLLLYHDLQWRMTNGITVETRFTFFDTASFDSGIYEFENDMRGVFSNPVLFGVGKRWYVLCRIPISSGFSLAFKYAETQKEGVDSIGSGLSEIEGDLDNRVSVQCDVAL